MKLEDFLEKNGINLSLEVEMTCRVAIDRMAKSTDVLHNEEHLFRLLDDLDQFLQKEKSIKGLEINFDILLLALCWHDVWKVTSTPATIFGLLIDQWWDGLGSLLIFNKEMKKFTVENGTVRAAGYVIRKHAYYQFLPFKTIEAKILRDIDNLDIWSLSRTESLEERYLFPKPNLPMIKLGKFYVEHFMAKDEKSRYHFLWTREEAEKRKRIFFKEINKTFSRPGLKELLG